MTLYHGLAGAMTKWQPTRTTRHQPATTRHTRPADIMPSGLPTATRSLRLAGRVAHHPVTLLSTHAGQGKQLLLLIRRAWPAGANIPVAWGASVSRAAGPEPEPLHPSPWSASSFCPAGCSHTSSLSGRPIAVAWRKTSRSTCCLALQDASAHPRRQADSSPQLGGAHNHHHHPPPPQVGSQVQLEVGSGSRLQLPLLLGPASWAWGGQGQGQGTGCWRGGVKRAPLTSLTRTASCWSVLLG